MRTKTEAARRKDRAKLKRDLIAQLEAMGRNTPYHSDLVTLYLDSRERLIDAQIEYDQGREAGLDPSELNQASEAINLEAENMANLMALLMVSPRSARRAQLEAEIRKQLDAKGLKGPVFEDRIDQFLKLWDAFQEANKSLVSRGRTYFTVSSAGKEYEKDNAACKDLVTLAKAMEDILDSLDITVHGYTEPDDKKEEW